MRRGCTCSFLVNFCPDRGEVLGFNTKRGQKIIAFVLIDLRPWELRKKHIDVIFLLPDFGNTDIKRVTKMFYDRHEF